MPMKIDNGNDKANISKDKLVFRRSNPIKKIVMNTEKPTKDASKNEDNDSFVFP